MPCPPLPVVHLTAKLGGVGRLLQLLDSRPDMVDADDHEVTRQSPLHYACEAGRVGAVRLLLDRAACIDRRDAMGYTPLMVACKYGWAEVVSLLLARGADTGLRNCCYLQETVLMHACCCTSPPTSPGSDHVAVVRLLLKHGAAAAINERDRLGQTALLKACLVGSMGVARVLLVEGGADPWLPDRRGSTPMHAALTEGRTKCVELLQEEQVWRLYLLRKARAVADDTRAIIEAGRRAGGGTGEAARKARESVAPLYLRARASRGEEALPCVSVAWQPASETRCDTEEECERMAVCVLVVRWMSHDLFVELLNGLFPGGHHR